MRPEHVDVEIGELVLDGVEPRDEASVRAAVKRALAAEGLRAEAAPAAAAVAREVAR